MQLAIRVLKHGMERLLKIKEDITSLYQTFTTSELHVVCCGCCARLHVVTSGKRVFIYGGRHCEAIRAYRWNTYAPTIHYRIVFTRYAEDCAGTCGMWGDSLLPVCLLTNNLVDLMLHAISGAITLGILRFSYCKRIFK